jgi:nucleotide-binding universal stress UspA family protein
VTSADEVFAVRRVVVALDASDQTRAAVEAGARLAARLGAELRGVFVEDVNLIRLVRLSSTRHLLLPTGTGEALEAGTVETHLRSLAARARQRVEACAGTAGVQAISFRVTRGSVPAEILAAGNEGDLLVLGWATGPEGSRRRLGTTARAAVQRARTPVLLVPQGAKLTGRIATAYDGSAASERALRTALRVAEAAGVALVVLVRAEEMDAAPALQSRAEAVIGGRESVKLRRVVDGVRIGPALRAEAPGLLVLGVAAEGFETSELLGFLEETGLPVLLVR